MNLSLRKAEASDYDFLLELRNITMNAHIKNAGLEAVQESHKERIHYHYDSARIIMMDNLSIGLLKLVKEPQLWTLVQIQLMPEFQGKGLGERLIKSVLDAASAYSVSVKLSVYKCNPAYRLYQRLGFVVYEETDNTFEMKWDNNVIDHEIK